MRRSLGLAVVLLLAGAGPVRADDQPRLLNGAVLARLSLAELTPCDGSERAPAFRAPAEAAALRGEHQVRRRGRRLHVGRAVFRDRVMNIDLGAGETHSYIGRYGGAPVVLLASTELEGWGYTLVDPASGRFVEIAAPPSLGPDGRTFVSAPRNEDYHDASIEISTWAAGAFTSQRIDVAACALAWDGPDRITFRTGFSGGLAAALERHGGIWRQVGP